MDLNKLWAGDSSDRGADIKKGQRGHEIMEQLQWYLFFIFCFCEVLNTYHYQKITANVGNSHCIAGEQAIVSLMELWRLHFCLSISLFVNITHFCFIRIVFLARNERSYISPLLYLTAMWGCRVYCALAYDSWHWNSPSVILQRFTEVLIVRRCNTHSFYLCNWWALHSLSHALISSDCILSFSMHSKGLKIWARFSGGPSSAWWFLLWFRPQWRWILLDKVYIFIKFLVFGSSKKTSQKNINLPTIEMSEAQLHLFCEDHVDKHSNCPWLDL